MTKRLYLEDLRVGQRLRSASVTITAQDIIRFARDSDPQYFHLDEEAAKDSMFGGLVASGWQTGALSVKLLIDLADPPFAGGLVGVEAHIAWKLPVRPGDSLRVEAEITRIVHPRRYADRGFVSMDMATYNQRGEVVLTQSVTVVAFRDPARAGESSNDAYGNSGIIFRRLSCPEWAPPRCERPLRRARAYIRSWAAENTWLAGPSSTTLPWRMTMRWAASAFTTFRSWLMNR